MSSTKRQRRLARQVDCEASGSEAAYGQPSSRVRAIRRSPSRSRRRSDSGCSAALRNDEARNERLQREHLQHLTGRQILGKLVLNGATLTEQEILGVSIYDAELEETLALAQADPKIKAGYLTVEAIPWMAVSS